MRRLSSLLLFGLCMQLVWAQDKPYFQQQSDYKIKARLHDKQHELHAHWVLDYRNNSPDTLNLIYLHLWPNAYKHNYTAFARHFVASGSRKFHFAKSEERGWIDSLNFKSEGQTLDWSYDPDNPDIALLRLAKPLAPGASIRLESPFRLRFPASFSRLGRVGTSYQVTQWYPKPAVYDRQGWHPMPYLNQGEFFSEFGSFEVVLEVPENYWVGATGQLQEQAEREKLSGHAQICQKISFDPVTVLGLPDSFPASSETYKTLTYKAERVHDFAWFADKRFFVLQDTLQLPSGRVIDVTAMFTKVEADLWKDALLYLKRSVLYYSARLGEYPYPQVTAVQSALSAGGGMEYPMITVIATSGNAQALDVVITHEVGHNWFYGILASNERRYPWQDEGFNTYIERRYTRAYYKGDNEAGINYLAYLYQHRRGNFQALGVSAEEFMDFNYWLSVYNLPALWLDALEYYVGTAAMDSLLQAYYANWQFKHPYPRDIQAVWEAERGESLAWLFEEVIERGEHLDWALERARYIEGQGWEVKLSNRGKVAAPLPLALITEGDTLKHWVKALLPGRDTVLSGLFPEQKTGLYWLIDPDKAFPEAERNNNIYRLKGLFRQGQPLKLALAFSPKHPERPRLNLAPGLGFNARDGFMLGLSAYNLPELNRWHYRLSPLWGFGSGSPVGMAEVKWQLQPDSATHQAYRNLGFSLNARRFSRFEDLFYNRLAFKAWYSFGHKTARNPTARSLSTEHIYLGEDVWQRDSMGNWTEKALRNRTVHRLSYLQSRYHSLFSYTWQTRLELARWGGDQHYSQLASRLSMRFAYSKKYDVHVAFMAGGFLSHSNRDFGPFPLQLSTRNFTDYHYDELFLGRNMQRGIWQNFVGLQPFAGGFKVPMLNAVDDGRSNAFITATNLAIDLPLPIKFLQVQAYFDLGYSHPSSPLLRGTVFSENLRWNGGLSLYIYQYAAIHIPLFSDPILRQQLRSQSNPFSSIGLMLNLEGLRPLNLVSRDWF